MRVEHQIKAFEQIMSQYDGSTPLNRFLPAYFKQNKKMGSSDRRWAARHVYGFFRLGKALLEIERTERLAIADFLCNQTCGPVVETYLPDLRSYITLPVLQKLELIKKTYPDFILSDVFPFQRYLSDGIGKENFFTSFFIQPDLFLRVDETYMKQIVSLLKSAGTETKQIGPHTLALPNGTKLEQQVPDSLNYQVQDLSSQKTGQFFKPQAYDYWWDCCAASGGKSLLLQNLEPKIELLVSDVRENSLHNLDERFRKAGLSKYQKKVLDLLQNNEQDLHHYEFDGIILDAPCSGSGTWGRTPEMLYYFDVHRIDFFSRLQKSIASNVIQYLKVGKPLIYITCSVFKSENEDVIEHLLNTLPLKLERMEIIKGYEDKADTMFAARLIKTPHETTP